MNRATEAFFRRILPDSIIVIINGLLTSGIHNIAFPQYYDECEIYRYDSGCGCKSVLRIHTREYVNIFYAHSGQDCEQGFIATSLCFYDNSDKDFPIIRDILRDGLDLCVYREPTSEEVALIDGYRFDDMYMYANYSLPVSCNILHLRAIEGIVDVSYICTDIIVLTDNDYSEAQFTGTVSHSDSRVVMIEINSILKFYNPQNIRECFPSAVIIGPERMDYADIKYNNNRYITYVRADLLDEWEIGMYHDDALNLYSERQQSLARSRRIKNAMSNC